MSRTISPTNGQRKVEANALAAHPIEAQTMVEAAITRFVPQDWPEQHTARLGPHREAAHAAFARLIRET
jgi:hypothetical protein